MEQSCKNIINYKGLSRFLAKSDNTIRSKRTPEKYKLAVTELENIIEYWMNKHKSTR